MNAVAGLLVVTLFVATANWPATAQGNPPLTPTRTAPAGGKEPTIQRIVLEDDGVRIDELRVRGITRRIVVTPKTRGAKPYEIVPNAGGGDPSQPRGNAGQRQWSVLSF